MAVQAQRVAQFSAEGFGKEAAFIGTIDHKVRLGCVFFVIAQGFKVKEAGAHIFVPARAADGQLRAQPVKVSMANVIQKKAPIRGQVSAPPVTARIAVLGQVGAITGGLHLKEQFIIAGQIERATPKQVGARGVWPEIIAGHRTIKLDTTFAKRLTVAKFQRARRTGQIGR